MYFHSSWQMPKCETSTKVDSSNATNTCHLLPTSFGFRDFERTTNSRSSSLMIPRTLKFGMPKWAQRPMECEIDGLSGFSPKLDPSFYFRRTYPLTETWDPPFRRFSLRDFGSCVDHATLPLESRNPETRLVPNAIVPRLFGNFSFPSSGFREPGV
jgi:hypothetical protein